MSEFSIQMGNMRGEVDNLSDIVSRLNNSREDINRIISTITISGEAGMMIKKSLKDVLDNLDDTKQRSLKMASGLSNIINRYETAENTITGAETKSQKIIKGSINNKAAGINILDDGEGGKEISAFAETSLAAGNVFVSGSYGTLSLNGKVLSAGTSVSTKTHWGNGDYSASIKAGGSASLAEGDISADMKYGKISASGSLLSAKTETEFGAGITFKSGLISGEVKGSFSADVAVGKVKTEGTLGTDQINIYGKTEGSVIGAGTKVEGEVSFKSSGEFCIKGETGAEAYLAKGEVEGGFSLFGVKIKASGDAMLGVQAKAGGKLTETEASAKLGFGPFGGKVTIDWSDFELPGFNGASSKCVSDLLKQAHPYMQPMSEPEATFSGGPTGALMQA